MGSMLFETKKARRSKTPKTADEWKEHVAEKIREHGLPEPTCEHRFAALLGRNWRFDFAWPSLKLALEIEGAVFGRAYKVQGPNGPMTIRAGGRHSTGAGLQADAFKYNRAAILGWLVIRATTTMVRDGHAITELVDAFKARGVVGAKSVGELPPVE